MAKSALGRSAGRLGEEGGRRWKLVREGAAPQDLIYTSLLIEHHSAVYYYYGFFPIEVATVANSRLKYT